MPSETEGFRPWGVLAVSFFSLALLVGCGSAQQKVAEEKASSEKRERAFSMWKERCERSGEFIKKIVPEVEGIYLVNVRVRENSGELPEDQFSLDDPYGGDLSGEAYIDTFVRGSFGFNYVRTDGVPKGWQPHLGFKFVEAHDPQDGKLYRYTGRVVEPWRTDKSYSENYKKFVLDKTPISARSARYGVQFSDISTREERLNWIAGGSLRVIDLDTHEIIAERIGYMIDSAQGSRVGGRLPWLFAADNACPEFGRDFPAASQFQGHKNRHQFRQTQRFVEKTLKPAP